MMGSFWENFNIQQLWSDFTSSIVNVTKTMTPLDGLDILLMAFLIYKAIKIVSETRAGQLVKGIALLALVFFLSSFLQLKTLNFILTNIFQIGVIAFIIVFQPEMRRALEKLGRTQVNGLNVFSSSGESSEEAERVQILINAVTEAMVSLSADKVGAIIVFERKTKLGEIIKTGTIVDAAPTSSLIGNIFFKNSPLHDGAMIVREGKIYAAGCVLPLSDNDQISRQLGTRHRAALGMSENSDALVVVCSEETGNVSIAYNGVLTRGYDSIRLRKKLEEMLLPERHSEGSEKRSVLKKGRGK